MADLKTDYKSDVLSPSMDGKRKFNIVDSEGNVVASNVHIEDVSSYSQLGDNYSADDINTQNEAINKNADDIAQINTDLSNKMTSAIVSTETAIGTFEGSTLYRKIITGSGARSSAIIDSSINSNNCSPIKLYGYVTVNVDGNPMKYPIEFYSGDNTLSNINITHNGVNAIIKWSTRTITEWKIIIEYFKL